MKFLSFFHSFDSAFVSAYHSGWGNLLKSQGQWCNRRAKKPTDDNKKIIIFVIIKDERKIERKKNHWNSTLYLIVQLCACIRFLHLTTGKECLQRNFIFSTLYYYYYLAFQYNEQWTLNAYRLLASRRTVQFLLK